MCLCEARERGSHVIHQGVGGGGWGVGGVDENNTNTTRSLRLREIT